MLHPDIRIGVGMLDPKDGSSTIFQNVDVTLASRSITGIMLKELTRNKNTICTVEWAEITQPL
jgi:hypothetical protein